MILVIASQFDAGAVAFVKSLGSSAALLIPQDLSTRGWRLDTGHPSSSTAIASGQVIAAASITGVLTLLPRINEYELGHIVEEDRRYVAAEMAAFLLAWLTMLSPSALVMNRPQPSSLVGPAWSPLRWRHEAVRAGFRLSTVQHPSLRLTLVRGRCFGHAAATSIEAARHLAARADVDLLSLHLDSESAFVAASLRPPLHHAGVASAIQNLLQRKRT